MKYSFLFTWYSDIKKLNLNSVRSQKNRLILIQNFRNPKIYFFPSLYIFSIYYFALMCTHRLVYIAFLSRKKNQRTFKHLIPKLNFQKSRRTSNNYLNTIYFDESVDRSKFKIGNFNFRLLLQYI